MPWIETRKTPKAFRVCWREGAGRKVSAWFPQKWRAEQEQQRVLAELAKTHSPTAVQNNLTIPEALSRWSTARAESGRTGIRQRETVTRAVTTLAEACGWKRVADMTWDDVERWRARLRGATGRTSGVRNRLACLQAFSRWCQRSLHAPVDQRLTDIELPRIVHRRQPELLTDEQLAAILDRAKQIGGAQARAAIHHLATYGCRPADLCRLRVADLDPFARTVTYRQTKNGTDVTHPIGADHARALVGLVAGRKPTDLLFQDPQGKPWADGTDEGYEGGRLTDWYRANCSSHLLPPSQRGIYCLKDRAITRMMHAGMDDRTIILITGHKTMAVLARYKTTNLTIARAAVALIDGPAQVARPVVRVASDGTAGNSNGVGLDHGRLPGDLF